jgi:hypothetical protein
MLSPDYRDMLSALSDARAEYLVVGAFAMAAHGLPRATGDLDIWVRPDPANARRVMEGLAVFGAPVIDMSLTEADLSEPGLVCQIGIRPRQIDVMTHVDGVEFGEAWAERVQRKLGDVTVPVISRRHLMINKRATGRAKDLADVAWIEEEGDRSQQKW